MSTSVNIAFQHLRADYPHIVRCVVAMGYDNGVINRFNTEAEVVSAAMSSVGTDDLQSAELWLKNKALSDIEIDDLCCGGSGADGLPLAFPDVDPLTHRVLDDLFENLVP